MIKRYRAMVTIFFALVLAGLGCVSRAGPAATPASTGGGLATPTGAGNSPPENSRSALLSELLKTVDARDTENAEWGSASEGQTISVGGGAKTGEEARARIDISDGTILRLGDSTEFRLTDLSGEPTDPVTTFVLDAGKVWVFVTQALGGGSFEIETPVGSATVRGSLMSTEYHPGNGQMIVSCLDGQCRLTGASGNFTDLQAGEQSEIPSTGLDPAPRQPIDAAQLADWAGEFPQAAEFVAAAEAGPEPTPTPTSPGGGTSEGDVIITGFWRETYGDGTVEGQCRGAVADGGGGAEPFTHEVPLRWVEEDDAILFQSVGNRYDNVSPGLYATERVDEQLLFDGTNNTLTSTLRDELRVLSPSLIERVNTVAETGGCTITIPTTIELVSADDTVLLVDESGQEVVLPKEGEYTVTWQPPQPEACPSELAEQVPTFDKVSVARTYDNGLVLYGSDIYFWMQNQGFGSTSYSETREDGSTFSLSLDIFSSSEISGSWFSNSSDFTQNCFVSMEMKRVDVETAAPTAP